MQTLLKKALCVALGSLALAGVARADEAVIGEGRAPLGAGNASAIRGAAKQEAVRDAVLKAIKDATALDASEERFAPIVTEIAKQMRDIQVTSEESVGSEFVTRVQVWVDRKQIKNAIRGTDLDKLNDRSFSILMLVDEFVTSTRDLNLPLEELVEMKYDGGFSYRDKSIRASSASASSSSAAAYSGSMNAAAAQSSSINANSQAAMAAQSGRDGYAAGQQASLQGSQSSSAAMSARANYSAASASRSASASVDAKNVAASGHEKSSYKRLTKYQDTSKPTNRPLFLNEFSGKLRDYDLRLLDSSNAKSKFFGDKPINLTLLGNSTEMAKFSEFARTKANADFLLVGSATVISGERSGATGEMGCVVNAEVKAFATAGGEMIASMAESVQASGPNIEGCAGVATQKAARLMAPGFASSALGYWADRSARGRQYTVEFKGSNLALPVRMAFAKALRDIDGATAVEKKEDGPDGVKVTLTLKGKGDAMEQVYGAVSSQPAFAGKNLDGSVDGEMVTLCLDKCGAPAKAATRKK
jgi:hypothetical protein